MATSANLGYPRIGPDRELKRATEAYWSGRLPAEALHDAARRLRLQRWRTQREAGVEIIPSNDFSLYDHVLDTAVLVGAVPERDDQPRRHTCGPARARRYRAGVDPQMSTWTAPSFRPTRR